MPELRQLIEAALPAGAPASSLRDLSLFHSQLEVSALQGCPQLAHVTRLMLSVCIFRGGGAAAAAAAVHVLLQQAPRLQSLTLLGLFRAKPFPATLVERTGLKELSLKSNGLSDLAGGPYLQGEPGWARACRSCVWPLPAVSCCCIAPILAFT